MGLPDPVLHERDFLGKREGRVDLLGVVEGLEGLGFAVEGGRQGGCVEEERLAWVPHIPAELLVDLLVVNCGEQVAVLNGFVAAAGSASIQEKVCHREVPIKE